MNGVPPASIPSKAADVGIPVALVFANQGPLWQVYVRGLPGLQR
jgi:hypothetical protein